MKLKIFITGGTGLLGKSLVDTYEAKYDILAAYYARHGYSTNNNITYLNIDIRNKVEYENAFEIFKPDVVVHTAGINSPDYVEMNRELACEVNIGGLENILGLCEKYNAKFIYISSNGIYDGKHAPYREEDKAEPVNYYGWIKLEGEKITKNTEVQYAIVRPVLMYGWNNPNERQNIVVHALNKLARKEKVFAYEDVYVNPLLSLSCAQAIWKIVDDNLYYNSFNIAGSEVSSVYGLLKKASKIFGMDEDLVIPVKQGFFNEMARRPKNTSYNTEKMKNILGINPLSLDEGLRKMKETSK